MVYSHLVQMWIMYTTPINTIQWSCLWIRVQLSAVLSTRMWSINESAGTWSMTYIPTTVAAKLMDLRDTSKTTVRMSTAHTHMVSSSAHNIILNQMTILQRVRACSPECAHFRLSLFGGSIDYAAVACFHIITMLCFLRHISASTFSLTTVLCVCH